MIERWCDERLSELEGAGLLRSMREGQSPVGLVVEVGGQAKRVFCSNNYLGLAGHAAIVAAVKEAVETWGFGSGASRLICGDTAAHRQVEGRLAGMLGKEAGLVFPTGFMTNYAVLGTLAGKGDLIAIDKAVHASLIDGARASGAQVRSWAHRQIDKLVKLLDRGGYRRAFIVTDSLFSMDGDRAPLAELAEVKRRYDAVLIVDEAHAFGCLGPGGRGVAAELGVADEVDIVIGTFSKALGGAGGFVAGAQAAIDYLVNQARGFIFTTGIPAVNCVAAEAALDVVAAEPGRRGRLNANGDYFRDRCGAMGLNIGESDSYIVPIILGGAAETAAAADRLWEHGFWISAIRPPTVKQGSSRLRVSLSSEHSVDDIDRLCAALGEVLSDGCE